MNYLIISDIHGSHERLKDVLNTPYPYDAILLVGDLMYHGPRNPILEDYNPKTVAEVLNQLEKPIVAVRGNCDSEVDQMLINFSMMQDYALISDGQRVIYLTHGHLSDPMLSAAATHAQIYISGHTHVPVLEKHNDVWMFNPGSIALPKENHPHSYGYYDGTSLTIYTLNHQEYMKKTIA